jgi:hypothetical protein
MRRLGQQGARFAVGASADADRFHTDVCGEEYLRRQALYKRHLQIIDKKRGEVSPLLSPLRRRAEAHESDRAVAVCLPRRPRGKTISGRSRRMRRRGRRSTGNGSGKAD